MSTRASRQRGPWRPHRPLPLLGSVPGLRPLPEGILLCALARLRMAASVSVCQRFILDLFVRVTKTWLIMDVKGVERPWDGKALSPCATWSSALPALSRFLVHTVGPQPSLSHAVLRTKQDTYESPIETGEPAQSQNFISYCASETPLLRVSSSRRRGPCVFATGLSLMVSSQTISRRPGSRSRSGAGHVVGERHFVFPLFIVSSGNWGGFDLF